MHRFSICSFAIALCFTSELRASDLFDEWFSGGPKTQTVSTSANEYSTFENSLFGTCGCAEEDWIDFGGQLRFRQHSESGMNKGAQRFINNHDDFLLTRLRLHADMQVSDNLRIYAEGIFAYTTFENLPPRPIDQNQADFLNLYADILLTDELTLRIGRQELLYGAQRTVSPLDWANTRRPFEGAKLSYKNDDWNIDAFFTHLVNVKPYDLDDPDYNQRFYGMYGVYSGLENNTLDLYYLGYDRSDQPAVGPGTFSLQTLGSRLNGGKDNWLWEFEGAVQFGDGPGFGVDQISGFTTAGIGHIFSEVAWKPTVWLYYDYASGNGGNPGVANNYNQLFPLAHKYLGFIDAVQRTNIQTPNILVTASPHEKIKLLAWYYYFMSNTGAAVPAIGGTPNQNTGRYLGQEIDLTASYQINPATNLLVGYSHFWTGGKINAATNSEDADFFYTQLQIDF